MSVRPGKMPRVVLTAVPFSLPSPPPPQQIRKVTPPAAACDSIHQNATTPPPSQLPSPTRNPIPHSPPLPSPSNAQLLVLASRIATLHYRCTKRLALARRELPVAAPLRRTRSFPTLRPRPRPRRAASPPSSTPSSIACPCSPSSTGSASRSERSVELMCLTCDEDESGEEK